MRRVRSLHTLFLFSGSGSACLAITFGEAKTESRVPQTNRSSAASSAPLEVELRQRSRRAQAASSSRPALPRSRRPRSRAPPAPGHPSCSRSPHRRAAASPSRAARSSRLHTAWRPLRRTPRGPVATTPPATGPSRRRRQARLRRPISSSRSRRRSTASRLSSEGPEAPRRSSRPGRRPAATHRAGSRARRRSSTADTTAALPRPATARPRGPADRPTARRRHPGTAAGPRLTARRLRTANRRLTAPTTARLMGRCTGSRTAHSMARRRPAMGPEGAFSPSPRRTWTDDPFAAICTGVSESSITRAGILSCISPSPFARYPPLPPLPGQLPLAQQPRPKMEGEDLFVIGEIVGASGFGSVGRCA